MLRTIGPANQDTLHQGLKRLKLRRTRDELEWLNEVALSEEPSCLHFLAFVVKQEIAAREETKRDKQLKAERFPAHRTLEAFDFSFQTSVSPQTVRDLASLSFLKARENVLLLGPPGVSASRILPSPWVWTADELVQELYTCLADQSVTTYLQRLMRHDLLIVDELGC